MFGLFTTQLDMPNVLRKSTTLLQYYGFLFPEQLLSAKIKGRLHQTMYKVNSYLYYFMYAVGWLTRSDRSSIVSNSRTAAPTTIFTMPQSNSAAVRLQLNA